MVSAYWWRTAERTNWGDELSPRLLEHFTGIRPTWSEPAKAHIVSTGSVLDVLPDGWTGIVAGSGQLHDYTHRDLTNATVLGVRGLATASNVRVSASIPCIGDPALLVSEVVRPEVGKYNLGIVPHWTDKKLYGRFKYLNPVLIDPTGDPLEVVKLIGSCKKIVASSLHGLIVADSFGIPRRAERFDNMFNRYEGGDYKYEDHASAIGQPIEWGKKGGQTAPRDRVDAIKYHLFEMFQQVAKALA